MGHSMLLLDPPSRKILHELIGSVLIPVVCHQHSNIISSLVLHESIELLEPLKDL